MGAIKGLMIAGTHSGVGKTTVALGLMAALRRRGLRVAPFKVGPDFIDPGHHALAAGRAGRNLDGWMLSREYNLASFRRHGAGAEVAVVEGVMGLFDGAGGDSEEGSTAQMATWLRLPVLLVVDVSGLARSAAALVQGFERFDPALRFAGVFFNNLGSAGHLAYLKEALSRHTDIPVLGGWECSEALHMPERHLGLVTVDDCPLPADYLQHLAERMAAALDLDRLLAALPEVDTSGEVQAAATVGSKRPVRIGVARDQAFCFYYPDNLELLAAAGAEIVPFSPLNDRSLPEALDGMYLGGGYPELHAAALAANVAMRRAVQGCSRAGMPIYAECGGFMYLCRELVDLEGRSHPMCDCFPFQTRMRPSLRALGYRRVRLQTATLLGAKGNLLRGHEFHYSEIRGSHEDSQMARHYAVGDPKRDPARFEGYAVGRTLGSYIHLHWGSRPQSAAALTASCEAYRRARAIHVKEM